MELLVCDTKAPGCSRLCTNEFFPFSPIALWKLQMLGVSLPIIIFVSYSEPFQVYNQTWYNDRVFWALPGLENERIKGLEIGKNKNFSAEKICSLCKK